MREADLAARTTIRVGGKAEWLPARAPRRVRGRLNAARERGFEPRVLGGGANPIVVDGVLPGVVSTTARMGARSARTPRSPRAKARSSRRPLPALVRPERGADARLVVWSGCSLPGLVRVTRDLGWSGFEGLAGVPGHLGGGIAMNAGGRVGETWDVVEAVRVLTREGELRHLERARCSPRYRDGGLGGAIVPGAVRFRVDEPAAVKERVADYLRKKSATAGDRALVRLRVQEPRPLAFGRTRRGRAGRARGRQGPGARETRSSARSTATSIVNRGRGARQRRARADRGGAARVADRTGIRLRTRSRSGAETAHRGDRGRETAERRPCSSESSFLRGLAPFFPPRVSASSGLRGAFEACRDAPPGIAGKCLGNPLVVPIPRPTAAGIPSDPALQTSSPPSPYA